MSWMRLCVALALAVGLSSSLAGAAEDEKKDQAGEKKVQTVDFRKLKELLPAELAGIKRSKAEGQKVSAGGFTVAMAEGTYEREAKENEENLPRVHVVIQDYGANSEIAKAQAVWAEQDIDNESDSGYTKSTKINGVPALETYQNEGKTGTLQMLVGKRFVLNVQIDHLPADQLQKVGKALPLDKLAALAK